MNISKPEELDLRSTPLVEMSPMTATIPMDRINRIVYKNFGSFSKHNSIRLSEFLASLELDKLLPDEYMIKFSKVAMIRSLILMELKEIKSHRTLSEYLKSHEEESLTLGFYKNTDNSLLVPDQRTFSYFVVHKLTEAEKELIKIIIEKIKELSEKFDINFEVESKKLVKKIETIKESNLQYQKEQKLMEFCKYLRKIVYPKMKLDINHNAKFTKNQILDILVHSAIEGSFTHSGANSYNSIIKKFNLSSDSPESYVILHHLKKHDIKSVESRFLIVFDEIIKLAKRSGIFSRKLNIAIDYTHLNYYGDINHPNIIRSKYDRGTDKYFRFATLDIVEDSGLRFTICVKPVFVFDRMEDVVKELLEYATSKIRINKVYMDRGFANDKIFNLLEKMRINYLIPLPEDRGIKKLIETMTPPCVVKNYKRGNAIIKNVVLVNGTKGLMKLATNIKVNNYDIELLENLPRMYGKRWCIETAYRTIKRDGLVRTTSNNYAIRLFYFLFSVAMYNLWGLINLLLMLELGLRSLSRRLVSFKKFCKNFYEFIVT